MKLVDIQQALFAAYDLRKAMRDSDRRKPTEGDNVGTCLDEIIQTLENLEAEIKEDANHYCEIFDTNHGELK